MKEEFIDIEIFQEVIFAFANGDFSERLKISGKRDLRDSLVAGINMLGEELEQTTVSRDYFSSIYNAISDIILVADKEGKVIDLNSAASDALNIEQTKAINQRFDLFFAVKDTELRKNLSNFFRSKKKVLRFETKLKTSNSEFIPVACSVSRIINRLDQHKGYLFIAKDITERKSRKQREFKIISSTQESERRRLAYDLHDSLGQEITAVKIYLNSLSLMDKDSCQFIEVFETCKELIDHSLDTIRSISFDLMPKSLENGGLISAIDELVSRLKRVCEIEYIKQGKFLFLDKDSQIVLYRIIQEFINNTLKHSGAKKISLKIETGLKTFYLKISDDGKGVNLKTIKYGNGLLNMKSRLDSLKADYNFNSTRGKGTVLELTIYNK